MRLAYYNHGGIAGFTGDFHLIDTELKKIVIVSPGCYERESYYAAYNAMYEALYGEQRVPTIDEFPWYMKHDFNENVNLLECFLPDVEIKSDGSVWFDDIDYELFLSNEKVPFRHITLNGSRYIENPALSDKVYALFGVKNN